MDNEEHLDDQIEDLEPAAEETDDVKGGAVDMFRPGTGGQAYFKQSPELKQNKVEQGPIPDQGFNP